MRTILLIACAGMIAALTSCYDCDKTYPYHDRYKYLQAQYTFRPGSYWVYEDSSSGAIDSLVVYSYDAHPHTVLQHFNEDGGCNVYGDLSDMHCYRYENGTYLSLVSHEFSSFYDQISDTATRYSFTTRIEGPGVDTLHNVIVAGLVYPFMIHYTDSFQNVNIPFQRSYETYSVPYVGIVRMRQATDTSAHDWMLIRNHTISP